MDLIDYNVALEVRGQTDARYVITDSDVETLTLTAHSKVGQSKAFQFMVRARNLIANNLPNAYATDAVSLPGETHAESAYRTRLPYSCIHV